MSNLLISPTLIYYVFPTISNTMRYLHVSPPPSFYMGQHFTSTMKPVYLYYKGDWDADLFVTGCF